MKTLKYTNANITVKVTDMFGVEDTFTDGLVVTAS